jgi:hypothetical protein
MRNLPENTGFTAQNPPANEQKSFLHLSMQDYKRQILDKTKECLPLLWIEHSASRKLLWSGRHEVDFSLALSQMS